MTNNTIILCSYMYSSATHGTTCTGTDDIRVQIITLTLACTS